MTAVLDAEPATEPTQPGQPVITGPPEPEGWTWEGFGQQFRRDLYATAYRLRRQLLPHAVAATVLGAGLAAQAVVASGSSPAGVSAVLAATAFPLAAGVAAYVRHRRRRWARRSLIAGLGAAFWLTIAPFGIGPQQAAALIAFEVAVAARWWHDNRIGYTADTPAAAAVEEEPAVEQDQTRQRHLEDRFAAYAASQGGPLPAATLSAAADTRCGLSWRMQLAPGKQTLKNALGKLDDLAGALGVGVDALIVEAWPGEKDPAVCRLQVVLESPVAGHVIFDGPRRVVTDDGSVLLDLGPYADGDGDALWRLYTPGSMWSGVIIGGTGIGKSRVVENIVISGLSGGDTEFVYIDPQRGGSSPALAKHADLLLTLDNVDEGLDALIAMLEARSEENAVEGWTGFTPGPHRPGYLIVIEECHNVLADPVRAGKVDRVAREGRKVGLAILCVSQHPGLETFGGKESLRATIMEGNAIVLCVTSNIAGQLMAGLDVNPRTLPKIPGYAFMQGSPQTGIRTAPFRNRDTADRADQWLERLTHLRPGLDVLTETATLAAGTFYRDRHSDASSGRHASAERVRRLREGILPEGAYNAMKRVVAALGPMGKVIRFPVFGETEPVELSASHRAVLEAVTAGATRPVEVEKATGLSKRRVADLLKELVEPPYSLLVQPKYGRYERAA